MLNYGDLALFFLWLLTLPTGRSRTVFSPERMASVYRWHTRSITAHPCT